jgi:thiosulfate dehydrogenase
MPDGVDYLHPRLSPEEAWDVAALMISKPRPHRAGLDKDFPNLLQKPIDAPYGPYADGFSEAQHKYGPYGPIREKLKEIEKQRGEVSNPTVR